MHTFEVVITGQQMLDRILASNNEGQYLPRMQDLFALFCKDFGAVDMYFVNLHPTDTTRQICAVSVEHQRDELFFLLQSDFELWRRTTEYIMGIPVQV